MSDTSGRVSFGPTGQKIRRDIMSGTVITGAAGTTPRSKAARKKMDIASSIEFIARSVWRPLQKENILGDAFLRSELVELLRRIAVFIEIAADTGIDGVLAEFGIKADSAFMWLQRRIREMAAQNHPTDFSGPANRAFQVGSTDWAAKLLHKKNPTKFKVDDLVKAVENNTDEALVLSPDLILLEYGKRIMQSAIGESQSIAKEAEKCLEGFERQHETFMQQYNKASDWVSSAIRATVAKYQAALLG